MFYYMHLPCVSCTIGCKPILPDVLIFEVVLCGSITHGDQYLRYRGPKDSSFIFILAARGQKLNSPRIVWSLIILSVF